MSSLKKWLALLIARCCFIILSSLLASKPNLLFILTYTWRILVAHQIPIPPQSQLQDRSKTYKPRSVTNGALLRYNRIYQLLGNYSALKEKLLLILGNRTTNVEWKGGNRFLLLTLRQRNCWDIDEDNDVDWITEWDRVINDRLRLELW